MSKSTCCNGSISKVRCDSENRESHPCNDRDQVYLHYYCIMSAQPSLSHNKHSIGMHSMNSLANQAGKRGSVSEEKALKRDR